MNNNIAEQIDAHRLSRMIDLSRRLNSATNVDELLHLIISEAAVLTNSEAASILLLDKQTRDLRFKAVSGQMPPELDNMPVPLQGSVAGEIFRTNAPKIVGNVRQHENWNPQIDNAIAFQTTSILGVPMHDAQGRPIGVLEALNKQSDTGEFVENDIVVLATLADLAGAAIAKAQLFEDVEIAYKKLNELDQLKSNFIALASHELRTPLSVILGYVSFLREDADEGMASQLDQVLGAAVRLRGLIQDMINLRYVDAGTRLERHPVDMKKLLVQILSNREEATEAKKIEVRLFLPQEPLEVVGDLNMLELVVSNLLSNAVKFTPSHGRVDVGAALRDDEVWLYMRDTGIGIPEDQLGRIFDRFYQVENHMRRHYEGMGIGLSIVKELVSLHGGRVWAKSKFGRGSEFFVALPANV